MVSERPWMLTAPWYRWSRPGVPSAGRGTAPALQKFAADDFVNGFLKDPQRSLKFDPDVDQVYAVHFDPVRLVPRALAAKVAAYYPRDAEGRPNHTKTALVPTTLLKLFLDTHSRHYLVVCELHCDVPGFPSTLREKACQAGFVVRRHYLSYPEAARPLAAKLLREIVGIQAKIAELEETAPLRPRAQKHRAEKMQEMKKSGAWGSARSSLQEELKAKRGELERWKGAHGVQTVQQGWATGPHDRIGEWRIVEDEPEEITEAWFPLYPVFGDPAVADHDARDRTLYFGVVPTSSFDTDANGKARFDDSSVYEIRCFARRHDIACPRRPEAPDCRGALTWSRPTRRYQIASQFDLEGTSNRPITIQMPSLPELAAQALKRPFGKYSPVKVIQPQGLNPKVDGTSVTRGDMGGLQICFFSIPLITIVALFVLNIFLPIVVFLFGLWFLLAFKFCIPPKFSLDAGVQAELAALGGLDVDANASLEVDVTIGGSVQTKTVSAIVGDLMKGTGGSPCGAIDVLAEAQGIAATALSAKMVGAKNSEILAMTASLHETSKLPKDATGDPSIGVDYTASLTFETRVRPEVVA